MAVVRFFAVVLIFICVSVAWMVLGGSMFVRTEMLDSRLSGEMARLWGPEEVVQTGPYVAATADGRRGDPGATDPSASKIEVDIKHEHRHKGLLWFSTFKVAFSGIYTVPVAADLAQVEGFFVFRLPEGIRSYDALTVTVDDRAAVIPQSQKTSRRISVKLDRTSSHKVAVSFITSGQDVWLYAPGGSPAAGGRDGDGVQPGDAMSELKDFSLTVTTDFKDIDYPDDARSPTRQAGATNGGMQATWQHKSLVTNQAMGIVMPQRAQARRIAQRMSFFAPVSLFFFFTVLFTVVVLKKVPLHPMHYLFISAAFFAFHLLLAYLVDQIGIHRAFWICAIVSVFLVISYMRLVAGMKFTITYVAASQLVYLIGFSYAFFFPGNTGLTITIVAILTLFVLMQATGRIKWHEVFGKRPSPAAPPVVPPEPTTPPPDPGPAGGSGR